MVTRNNLIVLNRGRKRTFRLRSEGSIIDLTIFALHLVWRIGDWCVLEVTTLSDHRYIELSIQERSHHANTGTGIKERNPSWKTRRLSKDKLREYLEKTRLIDGLGWSKSAESLEDTVRAMRRKVVAWCDYSMPRQGDRRTKNSMYWYRWNGCIGLESRQMVSQRRDNMWCPSGVADGTARVECHVWRFPAHGYF